MGIYTVFLFSSSHTFRPENVFYPFSPFSFAIYICLFSEYFYIVIRIPQNKAYWWYFTSGLTACGDSEQQIYVRGFNNLITFFF